jgi:hypothetical protein
VGILAHIVTLAQSWRIAYFKNVPSAYQSKMNPKRNSPMCWPQSFKDDNELAMALFMTLK